MASYDSTNHVDTLPGFGSISHDTAMTAPGSSGQFGPSPDASALSASILAGTTATSAVVGHQYESLASATRVDVSPLDTLIPQEVDAYGGSDANPISGVPGAAVGSTGAGQGTAGRFRHPNSGAGLGSGT